MTQHEARQLIAIYCEVFGITPEVLRQTREGKKPNRRVKMVGGVHVDYMRMCIGHYLRQNGYPVKLAANESGYISHASICHNSKVMEAYLSVNDAYVYPYWEALLEVANVVKAA